MERHRVATARAIAAVLLFGDWSEEMWPAARRCRDLPLITFELWFDKWARKLKIYPPTRASDTWLMARGDAIEFFDTVLSEAQPYVIGTYDVNCLAKHLAERLSALWPDFRFSVIAHSVGRAEPVTSGSGGGRYSRHDDWPF